MIRTVTGRQDLRIERVMMMLLFQTTLLLASFLCALVAGFLFAFAVVVMPGITKLDDKSFLRAFQVMDRVIQKNQPIFVLVWLGSVIALVVSVALGIAQLDGAGRVMLSAALLVYLFGVQLPTLAINVPLNNRLQALDIDALDASASRTARQAFEPRWNRWNRIRTVLSSLVAGLLMVLLLKLQGIW